MTITDLKLENKRMARESEVDQQVLVPPDSEALLPQPSPTYQGEVRALYEKQRSSPTKDPFGTR